MTEDTWVTGAELNQYIRFILADHATEAEIERKKDHCLSRLPRRIGPGGEVLFRIRRRVKIVSEVGRFLVGHEDITF